MITILIQNQHFDVKIWNRNMKYYLNLGYKNIHKGDIINVPLNHLTDGSQIKILVKCDYCGKIFKKNYSHYKKSHKYNDKDACNNPECKRKKGVESLISENIDGLWDKLEEKMDKHGYILLTKKNQYKNNKTEISYICPKHGEQKSVYANLIHNDCKCMKCANEIKKSKMKNSIEKVNNIISKDFNNIWLNPDEYVNAHENNLKILCGCCKKNVFTTSFANYKKKQKRCGFCSSSMSLQEKYIYDFLKEHNINFVFQKTFPDLKDVKNLIFDFYLPEYNLCIEYDGEQHYNTHFYETMPIDDPLDKFKYMKKHDEMKNKYCADNGIELLRIPYWEEHNIIDHIKNKLKEIGKRNSLVL